jgi:TolB protein
MKIRLALFLLVMSAITTSQSAEDVLEIKITQGIDDARPIAIVPFKYQGNTPLPQVVDRIIAADLHRSGQFRPLSLSEMPQQPATSRDVDFKVWRSKGVEAVVTGTITELSPGTYRITYELVDIIQGHTGNSLVLRGGELVESNSYLLLSRQATITDDSLRMYSHQISDAIYLKLTGIRGAFATRIAYVAVNKDQRNPYQLFVADSDGYAPQRLMASSEPVMAPNWSPDAKELAYVSFENGNSEIWIHNIYTGKRRSVSRFDGINSAPSWSPDGLNLAISLSKDGNSEIYILNVATASFTRITNHHAIDTEPSWSPDGRSLIFTSDRGGKPQIYRTSLTENDRPQRLTWEGDYNAGASYTSDGKNIVLVHRNNGVYHIARMDLANGYVEVLTDTMLDESPSIAPNGSMIIYAALFRNRQVLAAVSMDGRFKARLPSSKGGVRAPAWSPYLN